MDSNLECIVSPHEKGFWQADVYFEGSDEGLAPDWFCTGAIGGTKEEIISRVKEVFRNPIFKDGVTGICIDCDAEHFELENVCECCEGIVSDS